MANINISPNMNLPVPVVGQESGPQWASDINASLTLVDQHNHSAGQGVQINPTGLNINSDLTIGSNNLTFIRSSRYVPQAAPLALTADLNCVYVSGVDLYYNDGSGNKIQITQSGGIAGSPGSISNLTSPASASYVSANSTFVWQSDVNTPANMDGASYILRNLTANSHGLTLSPPAAMGSNFTLTLPTVPASQSFLAMDTSGNITAFAHTSGGITGAMIASATITGSNIVSATITGSNLVNATITSTQLAANSVGTTQIANGAVTSAKLDSTVTIGLGKAWINFDGNPLAGTYTQTAFTVSVTMTAHGMSVGQMFYITFSTGTAVAGSYTVLTATTNSFFYAAGTTLSTSGNCSRQSWTRSSFNFSVSPTRNGVGDYTLTFTNAMTDANYAIIGSARRADITSGLDTTFAISNTTPATTALFRIQIGTGGGTATEGDPVMITILGN